MGVLGCPEGPTGPRIQMVWGLVARRTGRRAGGGGWLSRGCRPSREAGRTGGSIPPTPSQNANATMSNRPMLGDIPKHGAGCFRSCRLANAARKPANGRSRACGELFGAEGIKLGVMPG